MKDYTEEIDSILSADLSSGGPGCAIAVIDKGQTIFRKNYGLADLSDKRPIDGQTIFHSASLSKQFTAAAVHLLEIEGRLSLSDSIRKYIPELHSCCESITIDHLIHHTSGLRDQWELLPLTGWTIRDPLTNQDILNLLSGQVTLNFAPGSEYLYCTSGYTLLAIALERISGRPFSRLCHELILKPLNMNNTTFHDGHSPLDSRNASAYMAVGDKDFSEIKLGFTTVGGTGLKTTVDDLLLWTEEWREKTTFPQSLYEKMLEPGKLMDGSELKYGSGFVFRQTAGFKAYGHGGVDGGFRSYIITYPDARLSIIILGNLGSMIPGSLVEKIALLFLSESHESVKKDEPLPTIEIAFETLKQRASLYYSEKTAIARTMETRGNRLFLKLGKGLELEAQTESIMRIKGRPYATYEFNSDSVIERIGSNDPVRYGKVPPFSPSKSELKSFMGIYHCPEVDVRISIEQNEGDLYLVYRNRKKRKLVPAFPNGFIGEIRADLEDLINLNLTFETSHGSIEGFRLNSRDVRNLLFIREES